MLQTSISDGIESDKKWIASYEFGNVLSLTGNTKTGTDSKEYRDVQEKLSVM